MKEQLSLQFSDHIEQSQLSAGEYPEPLSLRDRDKLSQILTILKHYQFVLEKRKTALSKERLNLILKARKGMGSFDGSQFREQNEQPVQYLYDRTVAACKKLAQLLRDDIPPSFQTKQTMILEIVDLLEDLKRWDATSQS